MQKEALLFFLVLAATALSVSSFDLTILNNLPEDERLDFLEYNVRLGYRLVHGNARSAVKISASCCILQKSSDAFAINIYKLAVKNHSVDLGEQGRGVVCFPNNQCVNVGDIGVHP